MESGLVEMSKWQLFPDNYTGCFTKYKTRTIIDFFQEAEACWSDPCLSLPWLHSWLRKNLVKYMPLYKVHIKVSLAQQFVNVHQILEMQINSVSQFLSLQQLGSLCVACYCSYAYLNTACQNRTFSISTTPNRLHFTGDPGTLSWQ